MYKIEKEIANRHFGNAERLLKYYFQTVWEKTGLRYRGDNDAEICEIIEEIRMGVEHDILSKLKELESESNGD